MILYLLLAWTIASFIVIIIALKMDFFSFWMVLVFFPGVFIILLISYIREFIYTIKCQIRKQENKYNQRLY